MRIIIAILLVGGLSINTFGQYGSKRKIYEGFSLVNDALEATKMQLNETGDKLYYDLTLKYQQEGDSAKEAFDDGMALREEANALVSHINNLKVFLIAKCEDKPKHEVYANDTLIRLRNLENFDDCSTPTELLIGESIYNPKEGQFTAWELKEKLSGFQTKIDSIITEEDAEEGMAIEYLSRSIISKSRYSNRWITDSFQDQSVSAIITYLSKLQIDIRLSEYDAIRYLIRQ